MCLASPKGPVFWWMAVLLSYLSGNTESNKHCYSLGGVFDMGYSVILGSVVDLLTPMSKQKRPDTNEC